MLEWTALISEIDREVAAASIRSTNLSHTCNVSTDAVHYTHAGPMSEIKECIWRFPILSNKLCSFDFVLLQTLIRSLHWYTEAVCIVSVNIIFTYNRFYWCLWSVNRVVSGIKINKSAMNMCQCFAIFLLIWQPAHLFQFWLGDQRGHSCRPALWARAIHHSGAHSLVAMGTLLCHGHHHHAPWGERHPELWPQQLHQAEPCGVPRTADRICRLLLRTRDHRTRNPGDCLHLCPLHLQVEISMLLASKRFIPHNRVTLTCVHQ